MDFVMSQVLILQIWSHFTNIFQQNTRSTALHFKVKPSMGAPVSLSAQLMWREYFYTMAVNNIDYDKMETNPICLNIPWYDNPEHEEKWTQVLVDIYIYILIYIYFSNVRGQIFCLLFQTKENRKKWVLKYLKFHFNN